MKTKERVIYIISRIVKIPIEQLNSLSGLANVDGWDSLNHTILVIELENEFNISFDFDELDKIITVDAIIQSLTEKGINSL